MDSEPASNSQLTSPRSTVARLPPELVDLILAHIDATMSYGEPSMRFCTLVCHTWRTLAQRYLFRFVRCIISAETCPAVKRKHKTLRQFGRFFAAHTDIALWVQMLHLATDAQSVPNAANFNRFTEYYAPEVLFDTLAIFRNLEVLCLSDVFVTPHPKSVAAPAPVELFKPLRGLYVHSRQRRNTKIEMDVVHLLGYFTVVEHVDISLDVYIHLCDSRKRTGPTRLAATRLSLEGHSGSRLLSHILSSASARTLRSIKMLKICEENVRAQLSPLLLASGHNLEDLELEFDWPFLATDDATALLNFSRCSSLRTLTLELRRQSWFFFWDDIWRMIATLSAKSNTKLESLAIHHSVEDADVLEKACRDLDVDLLRRVRSTLTALAGRQHFRRFVVVGEENSFHPGREQEIFPAVLDSL